MQTAAVETGKMPVPRYSWVVLVLMYLAAITAPLNMFKVQALMPVIIPALNIPITSAAVLMSVFSIAGLILALPGGILVQRLGVKASIVIAISATALGSMVGVLSTGFEMLAVSRVIEGIGFGLLGVAAPSGISIWFPRDRRGLPLGVFTTWVPFGMMVMLAVAPFLGQTFGSPEALSWQASWWFGAIFAVVVLVLVVLFFRMPTPEEAQRLHGAEAAQGEGNEDALAAFKGSLKVLRNGKLWLLALIFAIFNMAGPGGITQFLPTYLQDPLVPAGFGLGLDLTTANLLTAASAFVVFFAEPVCGFISDKIGSRKKIIMLPLFGLTVTAVVIFNPSLGMVGVCIAMFFLAVFSSGTSTGTYAASPEIAGRPEYSGMAMGVAAVGQNLGLLVGPLVISNVLVGVGGSWLSVALFCLVPLVAVAFVLSLFLKVR
jgi:MFS family permease